MVIRLQNKNRQKYCNPIMHKPQQNNPPLISPMAHPYPQLEGPHRSVGVHIPNSRGHTEAWESVSPTRGATPKCGSPYPQLKGQQKILLPSAVHLEERPTVSQSVPELASRQSDRYTQFGFFVSGRCGPKQQGGPSPQFKQWPSGNAARRHSCGRRFEPQSGHFGAAAGGGAKSQQTKIRTDACTSGIGCVTIGPLAVLPALCVPTACRLLSKNF